MPEAVEGTTPSSSRPSAPVAGGALHHERLLPGIGTWVVLAAVGAMCGVVIFPLGVGLSLTVGAIGIVLALVLGAVTAPVVEVRDGAFVLGRARIDASLLGEPEPLTGEDWQRTMGVGYEPLAYHLTRGWIRSGLRVAVQDPEDPTSAWVCSTRRPEDLALALRGAQKA